MQNLKLLLVPVLAAGLSGCGFLFVDGPPADYSNMNYVQCTESDVGPILDAVWAGINAAGAIAIAADPDGYEDDWDVSSGAGIASGVGWTILSGSSSLVGFNKVSDCRRAKREIADRQAGDQSDQEQQDGGPNPLEESLYEAMRIQQ